MIGEKPSKRVRFPVVKVRPGHGVLLRCVAEDVFSFHVHWLGARSVMCPGDDCGACLQGIGCKWLGLLMVESFDLDQHRRYSGLLELTESAYGRLDDVRRCTGRENLLGFVFEASRRSKRSPLGFVLSDEATSIPSAYSEVRAETIADAVATLYGLPSLIDGETVSAWSHRVEESARRLVNGVVARSTFAG